MFGRRGNDGALQARATALGARRGQHLTVAPSPQGSSHQQAHGSWDAAPPASASDNDAAATTTIDVEACQWGCFGWSPHGDARQPDYGRDAYPLRDGQTYEGDLVIDYAGPQIDFKPNHTDCPPPA